MATEQETPPSESVKKLAESTNHFAWDLYQNAVTKSPNENLFFSPVSIATAFGMTYIGARNDTARQMANVLHLDRVNPDHVHPSFGKIIHSIGSDSPGVALHTANRLFVNKNYNILESFADATKTHYQALAESHDFGGDSEGSRQKINTWVEDQTNKKIQSILPEGSIDALTALVLVNAIYFKGDWKSKFDKEATLNADFAVSRSHATTVPLMFQKRKFNFGYSDDLHAHAIQIPNVDERLSLFVVLPEYHQKTAGPLEVLQELEKQMTIHQLENIQDVFRMRDIEVHLSLPRFKLESSPNIKHHLKEMGMVDLFDQEKADLSGLDPKLFVSDVFHKAFIDINEEGSEAAAATAVVMTLRMAPRVHEFKADHPFLFFLHDNTTGLILFMGRMVNPNPLGSSEHTEL